MKAILIAAYLISAQVQIISEPTREPTQAATCHCQQGDGECICPPGECDCGPKAKPVIVSVRKPRIDDQSPITLAPLPIDLEAELERENSVRRDSVPSVEPFVSNYSRDEAAFVERWSDPARKKYVGAKLPPESPSPAAVSSGTTRPPALSKQPPLKTVPPIEQAAMVRTWVCDASGCRWEYRPAPQAPTKSVQTPAVQQRQYQRQRFILRPWRR